MLSPCAKQAGVLYRCRRLEKQRRFVVMITVRSADSTRSRRMQIKKEASCAAGLRRRSQCAAGAEPLEDAYAYGPCQESG